MNIKRNILVFNILWTMLVVSSLGWMLHSGAEEKRRIALLTARSAFKQIVITRRWNSGHGGVYVPITENNPPNPYLEDARRDLPIDESLTLTKINPALMTRQIGEIAMREDGVRFHITSLKPIRPENQATPVEKEFLGRFEQGVREESRFIEEDGRKVFKYMAPLITEKSCLACHARQGYQEGDIRGGIAVSLRRQGALSRQSPGAQPGGAFCSRDGSGSGKPRSSGELKRLPFLRMVSPAIAGDRRSRGWRVHPPYCLCLVCFHR